MAEGVQDGVQQGAERAGSFGAAREGCGGLVGAGRRHGCAPLGLGCRVFRLVRAGLIASSYWRRTLGDHGASGFRPMVVPPWGAVAWDLLEGCEADSGLGFD
ncbi:hypothetical protein GCM10010219_00900 [Streptomyces netropsis]|nr:hypothetical protein GCM10010219_00900 [Streptomyces netropsis]